MCICVHGGLSCSQHVYNCLLRTYCTSHHYVQALHYICFKPSYFCRRTNMATCELMLTAVSYVHRTYPFISVCKEPFTFIVHQSTLPASRVCRGVISPYFIYKCIAVPVMCNLLCAFRVSSFVCYDFLQDNCECHYPLHMTC